MIFCFCAVYCTFLKNPLFKIDFLLNGSYKKILLFLYLIEKYIFNESYIILNKLYINNIYIKMFL